jgi:hypothetical protein
MKDRKRRIAADIPSGWSAERIRVALATARHHARRFGHGRGLTRADLDDLEQDILLAIAEAHHRYDPARGAWSTFVALLSRHVLVDQCRRPASPKPLSMEAPEVAALVAALPAPSVDIELALALAITVHDLPPAPRALLNDIIAHRDLSAARESRAGSTATFYRELQDLRLWLRSLGLRPAPGATASRR